MFVAGTYMTFEGCLFSSLLFDDWLRKGCEWHVSFEILHIWKHLISFTLDWQFGLLVPLYLWYSEFSEESCSYCFLHSSAWTRAEHVSSLAFLPLYSSSGAVLYVPLSFSHLVCFVAVCFVLYLQLYHAPMWFCFVLIWFLLSCLLGFSCSLS